MVSLVKKMLQLRESLEQKKSEQAITVVKRQIDMAEQQINELTYKLYDVKLRFGYHSFLLTSFAQMGGMFAFPSVGSTLSTQAV